MKFSIKSCNGRIGNGYNVKIDDMTEPQAIALFEALLQFADKSSAGMENLIGYRVALSIHGREIPRLHDFLSKMVEAQKKAKEEAAAVKAPTQA